MESKKCPKCGGNLYSHNCIYEFCKNCNDMFKEHDNSLEEVYVTEIYKNEFDIREEDEEVFNKYQKITDHDAFNKELMLRENEYCENEYYWFLRIKEYTYGFIRAFTNCSEIRELIYCYKLYFSGQFLFERFNEAHLKKYIQDSFDFYKFSLSDMKKAELNYEADIQKNLDNIVDIEGQIENLNNYIHPRKVYNSNFRKKFKGFYIAMIILASLFIVGALSGCAIPFIDIEGKTKVWVIIAFIAFLVIDLAAGVFTSILTALIKKIYKKKIKRDIASKQKQINIIRKKLEKIRENALVNHCKAYRTNKIINLFEENFEYIIEKGL